MDLLVLCFLLVVWNRGLFVCTGSDIVVTPATLNRFVSVNSTANLTLTCNVSSALAPQGRDAVWQVQQRQILNDDTNPLTQLFISIGIFTQVVEIGVTELIISSEARLSYLSESPPNPNITVRCTSFTRDGLPSGDVGKELIITTFGIPSIPIDLMLNPNPDDVAELVFSWLPPANALAGVELTYTPAITGISLNISNTTNTSVTFRENTSSGCQTHIFSMFATNEAGEGPVASINETIPITPNITDINEGFAITQVSLINIIAIMISVPVATSCNPRFPILNYSISISSVLDRRLLNFIGNPFVMSLGISGLEMDNEYQVFIETCISLTCRQSNPRTLRTTDVQTANIIFFETNVFLSCTFASDTNARGCVFTLMLANQNDQETFSVSRSSSSISSQCDQTLNQGDVYSITVTDLEANDNLGTFPIVLRQVIIDDAGAYTSQTGCTIPVPRSPLSGGAVAGIVIAALIIGAVVLAVMVVVIVYRVRTGQWFKLREKDDDEITIHFEKELLMGDAKPKKKSKVVATASSAKIPVSSTGHDSPDEGAIVLATRSLPAKTGTEDLDMGAATNPNSAFTLDISSDRKKVRLHMNRALIKRVLQANKLNTMDRRRARRQTSISKQHLLPLQCEVRVEVEDDEKNNN